MKPSVPLGFVGPVVAVVLAAALGALTLHRYSAERADQVTSARALQTAQWLLQRGNAGMAELAGSPAVRWAGIAQQFPEPGARYAFLRKPLWHGHTDAARKGKPLLRDDEQDKAAADLLVLPEKARLPDGAWRSAAVEVLPGGGRHGAIVEVAPQPRVGVPWPGLIVATFSVLLFWYDLCRRRPASRKRPLWAAGVAAAGLLALLFPRLSAISAAEIPASRASADSTGAAMLLAGVVLLPIVLVAVRGALLGSGRSPHRVAYAYIAPALVGLGVLVLVPFLFGLALAFTSAGAGGSNITFVGLDNFLSILASEGRRITEPLSFYFTTVVTLLWTAVNVALHGAIGLGLALLLKDPTLRFKGVYRVLLIVPWAVPSYITALVWKGMFNQQYGLVNHVLGFVGITPVSWFNDFWTSFTANVVTNTWLGFPFMMVVSLGALQSIPGDLYEAASVDGASKWQSFRHITLPLLRPALVPALILGSVWTFNMFNIIYLVSGGEPGHSTDILITQAYRWAFEQDRYGYAAAYSVLIFVILLIWSLFTQRWTKAAEADT